MEILKGSGSDKTFLVPLQEVGIICVTVQNLQLYSSLGSLLLLRNGYEGGSHTQSSEIYQEFYTF